MTVSGGLAPSTQTAVTGTFTGTGESASFIPIPGRGFNISVYDTGGSGAFVGTVKVQRKIGGVWVTKWPGSVYVITDEDRSFIDDDPEHGVEYRVTCTAYTSGNIGYRISQ